MPDGGASVLAGQNSLAMRLFADQEFHLMTELISPFQARKYNIN
jgi:hypothetical protein